MRTNLKPKGVVYPLPVLIIGSFDENGVANAMNAAWGTVCDTNQVLIVISANHKSTKNILLKKEFTLSFADVNNVIEADYVGIVSGNDDINKIMKTKWTVSKAGFVDAPIFEELPLTLECKVVEYDEDKEILIGEVMNITADESILTDGKVDLSKFKPLVYDTYNHSYISLGQKVGNAFKDGLKLK